MRTYLVLVCSILIVFSAYGQSESSELWSGYTLKFKINKKWRAELEQQIRATDQLQGIRSAFAEMGVRYKITDYLNLKPQLRYSVNNGQRNEFRFSLDANVEWNFKEWNLRPKYRFRFQNTTVDYTGENKTLLRNQFELSYNLSRPVDPYVEYENFYRLNLKNEVRNHRYTFGLEWKLNKDIDLKTFIRADREVNIKRPDKQNILGLELSFDL